MYHAACKVEFQPFTRSYSQLTFFFNFLLKHYVKYLVLYVLFTQCRQFRKNENNLDL